MRRKNELSVLNIIFCILVILIHVLSEPVTALLKGTWQYGTVFVPWRLSAFVVQGFIFLSGLKMFLTNKNLSYGKYCVSRFMQIIVPYIIAVAGFYIYFLYRQYFNFSSKDLIGYILRGDLVSHFYFVIVIVQFYLLKPFWQLVVNKVPPILAITGSVILMFLCKYQFAAVQYNDRIFTTYLAYWVMGCYAGKYYEEILKHLKKHNAVYILQFAFFAVFEAIVSYIQFVYGGMRFLEELHFLYCISAILFTASLSTIIDDVVMSNALFKKIDGASYYIYLIHPLFIFITNGMLSKCGVSDIAAGMVIRGLVTYVASISLSILYLEMKKSLKRNKNVRIQKSGDC